MSSSNFNATLDLAPRPSLRALRILFWLHLVVVALALFGVEPGWVMAALVLAVAGSWLYVRRHPVFGLGPRALTRLTWHADGSWTLHEASGAQAQAELLGNSLIHPRLLVLNFRLKNGGTRHRMLLRDELDPEPFRRLHARLSAKVG
ncbi:MAG: hypothetical protein L0Y32_06115 [Nevskiales bacterium]|nr:hypothetical protein [Nevskiales bacterium]